MFRSPNLGKIQMYLLALVVKNMPAIAGDVRDVGSIPGSGTSPGEGNIHFSSPAWKTSWTEESGGLGSQS